MSADAVLHYLDFPGLLLRGVLTTEETDDKSIRVDLRLQEMAIGAKIRIFANSAF